MTIATGIARFDAPTLARAWLSVAQASGPNHRHVMSTVDESTLGCVDCGHREPYVRDLCEHPDGCPGPGVAVIAWTLLCAAHATDQLRTPPFRQDAA